MGLFDQFPYTNFHELNLDWILQELKEMDHTIDQFVAINALKYADPIQWDITSQYEKNTIVIDPQTGNAYISVNPVPAGVALTNTDYWTIVFDLGQFVVRASKNFANTYEVETTLTATVSTAANSWIVWGDTLYKALVNITAGDRYIIDGNIKHFTIEDVIGHLEDLTTTDKSNLVAAINETTARAAAIKDKPFINVKDYGATGDGVTDDYQAFADAIAASRDTGSTLIVPSGSYYLSAEPAVTDLNSGDNLNLLLDYNVEFTGAGAGNPNNPVFNGKLLSPVTNKGNRLRGWSFKSYNKYPSPAGNGSTLESVEWIADTSDDYISITGSIRSGSYVMTVDSTDGINIGDGIFPNTPITGWPDGSTRQNTVRVTAINAANNTIEVGFPSANPNSWAGIANSSAWTGATITSTGFKIRHRFWNVSEFIGSVTGSGNIDRVGYGINIHAKSDGNTVYGLEIDMDFGYTQTANSEVTHKGIMIAGFGTAQPVSKAIEIVHASANYNAGVDIKNAYHGIEIDSAGGIIISNEYHNSATNTVAPPLFGIKSHDIPDADLNSKLPFIAAKQPINNTTLIYLRRFTDISSGGMFIDCRSEDDLSRIFGVDIEGRIGAKGCYVDDLSATTGAITNLTVGGSAALQAVNVTATANIDTINCSNITTGLLKFPDTSFVSGSVTPTSYITLYDTNGVAHKVPCD